MKHKFLIQNNSSELILFFSGWGMDEHPFIPLCKNLNADFCVCYDYSDLSLDFSLFESYQVIKLYAWSMGVWIASETIGNRYASLPIREAVAINGTEFPIDDQKGIPSLIFQGTLESLSDENLNRFNRRMCGSRAAKELFDQIKPHRTLPSLREELEAIGKLYLHSETHEPIKWSKAIIGKNDLIFPSENQIRAWEGTDHQELSISHYTSTIPFI